MDTNDIAGMVIAMLEYFGQRGLVESLVRESPFQNATSGLVVADALAHDEECRASRQHYCNWESSDARTYLLKEYNRSGYRFLLCLVSDFRSGYIESRNVVVWGVSELCHKMVLSAQDLDRRDLSDRPLREVGMATRLLLQVMDVDKLLEEVYCAIPYGTAEAWQLEHIRKVVALCQQLNNRPVCPSVSTDVLLSIALARLCQRYRFVQEGAPVSWAVDSVGGYLKFTCGEVP